MIGEIFATAINFEPQGCMACDGRQLSVSDHNSLFNVIGTRFGGDGTNHFNLPDLRGRVPVHAASGQPSMALGTMGGANSVALKPDELPTHSHALLASGKVASTHQAQNGALAATAPATTIYRDPGRSMIPVGKLETVDAGQPHTNMQPYGVLNYVIAVTGDLPEMP